MSAGLYAILILLPPIITLVLLAKWRSLPPKGERLLRVAAAIVAFLVACVASPIFAGSPIPPPASAAVYLCLIITMIFLKPLSLATIVTLAFTALGGANPILYSAALYNDDGATDYEPLHLRRRMDHSRERLLVSISTAGAQPNTSFRAGYLDEMKDDDIQAILEMETRRGDSLIEYRIMPYWHTWMTDLWHMQTRPVRVWFHGGKLEQRPSAFRFDGIGEFADKRPVRRRRA